MSDEHLAREHGFQFVLQGADAANPVPLGIPLSALRRQDSSAGASARSPERAVLSA